MQEDAEIVHGHAGGAELDVDAVGIAAEFRQVLGQEILEVEGMDAHEAECFQAQMADVEGAHDIRRQCGDDVHMEFSGKGKQPPHLLLCPQQVCIGQHESEKDAVDAAFCRLFQQLQIPEPISDRLLQLI